MREEKKMQVAVGTTKRRRVMLVFGGIGGVFLAYSSKLNLNERDAKSI